MRDRSKLHSVARRARVCISGFVLAAPALAQTAGTGAIAGAISDPAGRTLENAKVVAVNEATHALREAVTTSEGLFRISLLAPGSYVLAVSAPGFSRETTQPIRVQPSGVSSFRMALRVAGDTAQVEVRGDAAVADVDSSSLGALVDQASVVALPLSNRNYTQLLGLSPGVVVSLPSAAELGRGTQNVASNGAKTVANNAQFNGMDANNLAQNSMANDGQEVGTAVPAPDAIQEFKIQTANYDAGYGRGSGANIDLVSKSGTNQVHGSAWEFLRNDVFNSNEFFRKAAGQPRPVLRQHQFGGSVGGPFAQNRSFFFVAYQGSLASNGLGAKTTALLPRLTDDRSARALGAQFCPAGHLDDGGHPMAGYLTHAGGTQVACDGSNINPVALAILNAKLGNGQFAVPNPQIAVAASDPSQLPVGQSTFAIPAHYREDQGSVNVDQVLTEKNTLAGRFFLSRSSIAQPFSPNAATVPGWGTGELDRNTMFVLADTHVFRSELVNVARFGYMRFDGTSAVEHPILASSVGEGTPTGAGGPSTPAPGLTIDGLFTIGDAGTASQWQVTNSFQWQDILSWTRGRQSFRFGAELKHHQVAIDAPFSQTGLLDIRTFADFLVGQSAAENESPIGSSNVTQSIGASGISRKDERYNDVAVFAQDDVKLTPRLTVNAGMRYEVFGAPYEISGRLPNFDPGIAVGAVPDGGTLSGFIVPSNFGGAVPAGVLKLGSRSLWPTRYGDVSPRLGFAWQLRERPTLVLRGGYGIYFDRHSGGYAESLLGQAPFSTLQILPDTANAGASLQRPFSPQLPAAETYPIFIPRTPGGFPFLQGVSPDTRDAFTHEYNLQLQMAPAEDYLLEVGYVGTRSLHRPGSIEFNQPVLASPAHAVNGETTNSTNNLIARLPFQGVSPGSLFTNSTFIANYDSLQNRVLKRLSHGLQFEASYTWSKSLDETSGSGGSGVFELWLLTNDQHNPRQAYGLTDFDRAHRGVLSLTWQTPRFGGQSAWSRRVLTNWQVSGIAVAQSGSPLTIMDGNAGSVYGNFENRAQRTGSPVATNGSLFERVSGRYLDGAAFTRAPEAPFGTSLADQDFGNSGVGIVRGPSQRNIDLALERAFPVNESSSFRFRAEFFNVTNTTQFANPSNSLNFGDANDPAPKPSASFGRIGSSVGNPRIVQFAVKYLF